MTQTLVISMEKVGSTTVMNAIRSVGVVPGRAHQFNYKDIDPADYDYFVTMMREPIAWGISFYFEHFRSSDGFGTQGHFRQSIDLFHPNEFFEKYVQDYIGINVYGQQFVKSKGWRILSERLLIIRTDKLSEQLAIGLAELLDMQPEDFTVEHRALGEERFGEVYTQFLKDVKFDITFLEELYDSRYCKHFFYAKKLRELTLKWSKSPR